MYIHKLQERRAIERSKKYEKRKKINEEAEILG
jgi:hypothetical protein